MAAHITEYGTMYPTAQPTDEAADSAHCGGAGCWHVRHNAAVQEQIKANLGIVTNVKPAESAVLALITSVEQYLYHTDIDPYVAENIVGPMLRAFTHALNHDLGRLDGGTLDDWRIHTAERVGLNPDTYEYVGR